LNAAEALTRGVKYPFVKIGLHLKADLVTIKGLPYLQDAGYLGSNYQATDPKDPFIALRPEDGWVRLSVTFGRFIGRKVTVVEAQAGESQSAYRDRMAFLLHGYMDAILMGYSFHIQPVFFKGEDGGTDEKMTLPERQAAYIAKYQEIFGMSDEDAAASYAQNVLQKDVRRAYGKAIAQNEQLASEGKAPVAISTVTLKDGAQATFEDLNGKTVRRFRGQAEIAGTILVGEENWTLFAQVSNDRRLAIEIVG
jgi:hypothetical protein